MAGLLGVTSNSESERKQLVAHDNVALSRGGRTLTHAAAGTIARGTILGRITATGKYVVLAVGASDGSQTACAIMAEDSVATAGGDKKVRLYFAGAYNINDIVWPGTPTAAQKNAALNQLSDRGIVIDCVDYA